MRWIPLSLALSLALVSFVHDTERAAPHAAATVVTSLPDRAWPPRLALERAVAERSAAHQPIEHTAHVELGDATLDRDGARVGEVTLALAAMGRGGDLLPLDAHAAPHVAGPEVTFARAPGVIEWWRSLPSGLEQGVNLAERVPGDGELVLVMDAGQDVRAELAAEEITLVSADARPLARYGELTVLDRDGASVPARLAVLDGHIAIHIDDRGARYPLIVDPLVAAVEARLTPTEGEAGDAFGASVSFSADGTRALVGAFQDDAFRGSAYVFVRTGTTWTEEVRLSPVELSANDRFGASVALSGDGRYAIVGAPFAEGEMGVVYVFRRTGSSWTQDPRLIASPRVSGARFGSSVAVDRTGLRVVIGAEGEDGHGRAYFFSLMGMPMQSARMPPDGFLPTAGSRYGLSVAMSASGDRALVGAPGADASRGVVDVYVNDGVWGRATTIDAGARAAGDTFGFSVAASSDGTRALVGALGAGAVHVFIWSVDGFTVTREATLTVPGAASLGASVSLSADAGRALAGVYNGGAFTWIRASTTWSLEATLPVEGDLYGRSVSLAGTGNRVIVGASGAGVGTAIVYGLGLDGVACTAASDCGSGFCVDGVCCNAACGGGDTTDCQACRAALTGSTNGTCAPLVLGTECRAAIGACDIAEACNGVSVACPLDVVRAVGTTCGPSTGAACDEDDLCDGTSPDCPARFASSTTVCAPALGPCDIEDLCTGTSLDCPARFAPAGTVCLVSSGGVCDTDDVCTGASGECLPRFLEGIECRPSVGGCDVAETCGSDPLCPTDRVVAGGTVCRASTAACDPEESCDGASAACPADEMTCSIDGGLPADTGPSRDAATVDAGVPVAVAGCGCRANSGSPSPVWLVLLALALGARRRG